MASSDPVWLYTDSIKIVLAVGEAVYAILQRTSPTNSTVKRTLHVLELVNAIVLVVWFIPLHSNSINSWYLHSIVSSVSLTLMVIIAILIAYNLQRAANESARVARGGRDVPVRIQHKSRFTWILYSISMGLMIICSLLSTALTLALKEFVWTTIRSFGQAIVLSMVGPYIAYSFLKLKNKIQNLKQLHLTEASHKRDTSELEKHYDQIQRHMSIMLFSTILFVFLALFGHIYYAIIGIREGHRTYQEILERETENYDVFTDLVYFIALGSNFYFQYYSSVRTRPLCCYKRRPRSKTSQMNSKRSVRSLKRIGPDAKHYKFTSKGFITAHNSPRSTHNSYLGKAWELKSARHMRSQTRDRPSRNTPMSKSNQKPRRSGILRTSHPSLPRRGTDGEAERYTSSPSEAKHNTSIIPANMCPSLKSSNSSGVISTKVEKRLSVNPSPRSLVSGNSLRNTLKVGSPVVGSTRPSTGANNSAVTTTTATPTAGFVTCI